MMVEEKLELLLELLTLMDAPDVHHMESEPEAKGDPQPENEAREDFGNSSGWDVHPHCLYIIDFLVWILKMRHPKCYPFGPKNLL
jgi:hypothetical protein